MIRFRYWLGFSVLSFSPGCPGNDFLPMARRLKTLSVPCRSYDLPALQHWASCGAGRQVFLCTSIIPDSKICIIKGLTSSDALDLIVAQKPI